MARDNINWNPTIKLSAPFGLSKLAKRSSSGAKAVVGLDLDPGHIAAAEVSVNGGLTVTHGAVSLLRPGILREGDLTDPEALTEALQGFFGDYDFPRKVRVGIANQRIVVRAIDLPPLDDEKVLDSAVKHTAPDHIPMPMTDAVMDYESLGIIETALGPRCRVVIVAVRRDFVERLARAVLGANLELVGIDLSVFAMVRALKPISDERVSLYLNVAGLVNIGIANSRGCLFSRTAVGGLDSFTATLAERSGLILEHARQWLEYVGLSTPVDEIEGSAETVLAARTVLEEGTQQLADTVRNSLNFYLSQGDAENIGRIVLTGPIIRIPGIGERLSEMLDATVEIESVHNLDTHDESTTFGRLSVAAGLAVAQR